MWSAFNGLQLFHWGIDQVVTGFATWLAASKVYDLAHGNKKRGKEVSVQLSRHLTEKVELQEEPGVKGPGNSPTCRRSRSHSAIFPHAGTGPIRD